MKNAGKFLTDGLLLSGTSLLMRGIGVAFHSYVARQLGAAGTGTYSLVLSVFTPIVTLATAGVNLAAGRMTAGELAKGSEGNIRAALGRILRYCLAVSLLCGTVLFLSADALSAHFLDMEEGGNLWKLLALSLPFVSLSAGYAGYFAGVRRVWKNALCSMLEQGMRILFTVGAIRHPVSDRPVDCLGAVILASCLADVFSCLLSGIFCRFELAREKGHGRTEGMTRTLLGITLPVSVSSFLRSGLVAYEHLLVPRGLRRAGADREAAMASYGVLSGMALPVIFFPASILYSFLGLLIPELAEGETLGDRKELRRISRKTVSAVTVFGCSVGVILFLFAGPIGWGIYKNREAAYWIRALAPLVPVMYLDTAVDTVLKGIGEQVCCMKINLLDAAACVLAVLFAVPWLGMWGYVLVIYLSEIINFVFSCRRLRKRMKENDI